MLNTNQLKSDIAVVQSLGELIQAYEEIYVVKMQQIRKSVLGTRSFMEGLANIYAELKAAYAAKLLEEKTNRKRFSLKKLSMLQKNGKTAAVYLSTSKKLSGDINQRVFLRFREYLAQHPKSDALIIGSVGKELYVQSGLEKPFRFFALPEEKWTLEHLKPIVDSIIGYEQVKVFYGKFVNFVSQQETVSDISGVEASTMATTDASHKPQYFLFEPSLETLLAFFETQIFASLFKQTAHESHLAQIGSRINALEEATGSIRNRLKELNRQKLKLVKRKRNRKQLQALAGMSLWNI